jgi:hypothetical protein
MKIVLVDDHQIMIDGLLALLAPMPKIKIIGIAKHGQQALEILQGDLPDIVLTDISMPVMDGIALTSAIKKQYPTIKVIALSMHGDSGHINEMIAAGVDGYIYKNVSNQELITALNKVYGGGIYYSPEITTAMMTTIIQDQTDKQTHSQISLTDREREIVLLISQEKSNADIAQQLYISERTVESHRKNIYKKTNTNSIVGLIKWAYENKEI